MSETTLETKFTIADSSSKKDYLFTEDLRIKAQSVINTIDFPTTRTEAWKYTRVAKIKNTPFQVLKLEDVKSFKLQDFLIPNLEGSVLVFVNGLFAANLSEIVTEEGLELVSLAQHNLFADEIGKNVPLEQEIFSAINTLYAQDGVGIRISKNTQLKQSIQLIFITSGENPYSGNRNKIVCEDFASGHIVMHYVSLDANTAFNNVITEIELATNAHLSVDKIQNEVSTNYNITSEFVNQAKDSNFTINTITLDGALVRNNLNIAVNGQNCETNLSGAYILKGKQHVDNHTVVDHKVAHCLSNELYKGVIDDQATAVFNGKVFVRKDAQKINAFQSNGNVLLSDQATVNSKPELEIYADDVKCSHGSTTGQLDEEAVFYLRARGISEKSARALMVSAFIGDVIEKIENDAVRDYVFGKLHEKFGWEK